MSKRSLSLEPFEERLLMAIDGPQLLAAIPFSGVVINENTVLSQAPREILLRFNRPIDASTIGSSIQFIRNSDNTWGNANDVIVSPGYVGIEDAPNEIIVRFDENLPDDAYRMTILGTGVGALKDTSGQNFNSGVDLTRNFSLDLGAQVVAIVPQPVSRDANGKLTQSTNTIDVYFNVNDPLDAASAQNINNYQLIRTAGTSDPTDDGDKINPISVTYSAATGKAVLTFNTLDLMTNGTYRLRIGTREPLATEFDTLTPGVAGSSFGTAAALGNPFANTLGTQTVSLTDTINTTTANGIIWPGSPLEPGERPEDAEKHVHRGSNTGSIPLIYYNFQHIYGQLSDQPQFNLITETQKQRVREVFEYYSYYLGVQFVETTRTKEETSDPIWTIALGLPQVLNNTPPTVGGVASTNVVGSDGLAIMNSAQSWGASEARGAFFQTALHEIGHMLGLGHNYEAPAIQGGGVADGVLPGDLDLIYARYMWPELGNEINVYQFNLATAGKLNVETIAERLQSLGLGTSASRLDSVITLFDVTGKIVARNDDYFGKDSFLQLDLPAGTYYVAITSTGNTEYDPRVENSGAGGTTIGSYQLRMTFTPTPGVNDGIRDTTGNRLDGDSDGIAGGVHNFWFNVAPTIHVDKASTGGTGPLGSLSNPYTRINDALAAAPQGSIVRIAGNGGADGNLATVADNLSYNVGFDNQNIPLSDGTRFDIPRGVTVMIDAGAIIKLRGANVNAGSFDVNINRSAGALQVLGTTASNATGDIGSVYFTSYYDRTIGTDPGTNTLGLAKGNWGGIVFRNDSDLEANGIFLNYVNQARISYGGGSVTIGGTPNVYRPIHLETARPTITFNTITNSADAAMLATPNSFEESQYQGVNYYADYTRVGPKVYGNTLAQNSINALFILVRTNPNSPLDELTVNGRIANTDIVHVLTETLLINGNPGGNTDAGGNTMSRPSARLAIDPGIIFKLGGGRFETEVGAQLIAEGTRDRPIIFTSLYDDRYGGGGTSDTTNNSLSTLPAPGNWGGFIFGPTSIGSIDYALVAFAGGETRFEGSIDNMQPVEIHQAQVRIANSTFDWNRLANAGARNGRGGADASVIYIRGAQPVILNNVIQNNTGGAVISVNLNSLNSTLVDDWGRSRGGIGLAGSYPANRGPLIRNNLVGNNSLNGMVVRGGQLTTNGVWDDTDIVHVLSSTINVANQQSLTGTLRLQSSPTESLVVKLLGTNLDIIAGGELLDIEDRTGGTLQIVGTPGHAVVITSVKDDTVGAGLTPQGTPQKDTRNTKGVVAPELPDLPNSGPVILDTTPRDVHGSSFGGRDGWDALERELRYIHNNSLVRDENGNKPNRILAVGYEEDPTEEQLLGIPYSADAIRWAAGRVGVQIEFADTGVEIASAMGRLTDFSLVYVMSHNAYPLPEGRDDPYEDRKWWGGATDLHLDTLNANKGLLIDYINNNGGGLLVMAQDSAEHPYRFAAAADPFILRKGGGNTATATELAPAGFADVNLTDLYLNEGGPYRSVFEGSTNFNRLEPWSVDPVTGEVIMLGMEAGGKGLGKPRDVASPGDWGTIRLDVLSNDRNVDPVLETEQGFTSAGDTNQTPTNAQFLGQLAKDQLSGDDNVRLGFEIHGMLSQAADSPGGADVDVYSFRGTAGTLVWLDIDRTSTSLDSVVELVDANGAVIARSNDSVRESAGTLPLVGSGKTLQIGTADASPYSQPDFYTTNLKDAGMRVTLPGTVGTVGTYFVRVRSNSDSISTLTGGITKGNYALQIRLQERDEFPGSAVRYADIRYASNGIEVVGKPEQSALISNTAQTGLGNGTFETAQDLGNLLETGSNTIDVAANLANANSVHWYKFSLNFEQIQSITGLSDGLRTFAAMLQVNYADGLGRPDTTMSLYDESGTLLFIARDGQIADSLPRPNVGGIGTDAGNPEHGSFGPLDPTLGPVHLQAGAPKRYDSSGNLILESVVTYYVAISSDARLPEALTASFAESASNPLIRLEPVDSVTRIIDDRVGFSGGPNEVLPGVFLPGITTAGPAGSLFPVNNFEDPDDELNSYADQYHLGDVVLFINTEGVNAQETLFHELRTFNPFTGEEMTTGNLSLAGGHSYYGMAMRNDGRLVALSNAERNSNSNNGNTGNFVQINTATGAVISVVDDGLIAFNDSNPDPLEVSYIQADRGIQFEGLAYWQSNNSTDRRLFAIGRRHQANTAPGDIIESKNLLFELNPDTGEVLHNLPGNMEAWPTSGTNKIPVGTINSIDQLIDITIIGDQMFGITASGQLYQVSNFLVPRNTTASFMDQAFVGSAMQLPLPFGDSLTGLVAGPTNVEGGQFKDTLFAIDEDGRVYAFDTSGNPRGVFLNGAWFMETGVLNTTGVRRAEDLTFSTLDFNMWHATTARADDAGHGINPSPNNARRSSAYTNASQLIGGSSYYFGLNSDTPTGAGQYASNPGILNTYAMPGGAYGTLTSRTFDLDGYSALDKPTLYFNYLLDTADVNSNISATDIFRVFASTDGVNWEILATSNVVPGSANSENPLTFTPSGGAYKNQSEKQKVQGLWDSTTVDEEVQWRQARVDLGDYAGRSNIRLRFQFTTAGTMGSGDPSLGTGRVLKALAGSQLSNGQSFSISGQTFVFRKGVPAPLATDIAITDLMTSTEVARAMAAALDRFFIPAAGNVDDPNIFSVAKVVGDELRLFERTITSAGPLPSNSSELPGDNHGNFESRSRDRYLGTFEGVYIDDFIVGFASRGEMVTGAASLDEDPNATGFASVPAVTVPTQILTGQYQLQIRPAQSYAGVDNAGRTVVTDTYDVNTRFAQGITLVAHAAAQIADGQTFNIDDGTQVLRFEFNLTGGQTVANSILINILPGDSAASVAVKIRDAINNAVLSLGFKVRASTQLSPSGAPNGARVDLFDALSVTGSGLQDVLVFDSVGDTRPQQQGLSAPGQTLIQNNIITHSRQVGILVTPVIGQVELFSELWFGSGFFSLDTAWAFTVQGQFPVGVPGRSGSIANLPTQNNKGWVPGITIKNNLITHSGRTGIVISGDPNASFAYAQGLDELGWIEEEFSSGLRDVELFLPFVRVLNNTVYDANVGIAAVNVASATIMNNILANIRTGSNPIILFQGTGVYVDPSSGAFKDLPSGIVSKFGESVVTANLYQNNTVNMRGTGETLAINLQPGDPLFVDAASDNFYLVAASAAIDSSVDSLLDRPELSNVVTPLGFSESPILAPEQDLLGQTRIDDPLVDPPAGVGGNVFKDRGALERADFIGPTAALLNPVDNDSAGADRNTLPNQVQLVNALITDFAIQLLDGGAGIDNATVDINKFVITRTIGGVTETLVPNFDFALAYDTNSRVARLLPAQGLWVNGTYTITLDRSLDGIKDLAGNILQENAPPQTRFVIDLTDTVVSGWQNPANRFDVNNDGNVSGQDLLLLINRILLGQSGPLPIVSTAPPYLDVNGDGALRTSDVLGVVNEILRLRAQPLVVEPLVAAEPLVENPGDDVPEAAPLFESNVIVAGLAMDESPAAAEPQVASEVMMESEEVAPPQAVAAAILADYPGVEGSEELDPWDDEMDGVLTELTGDLK